MSTPKEFRLVKSFSLSKTLPVKLGHHYKATMWFPVLNFDKFPIYSCNIVLEPKER